MRSRICGRGQSDIFKVAIHKFGRYPTNKDASPQVKEKDEHMSNATQQIVNKAWNFAHVLRDDGLSYMAYTEQITFLLFLKMADELTKPPYNRKPIVPPELGWRSLLERDGDELEVHYRHVLEELGKKPGMSATSAQGFYNNSTAGVSLNYKNGKIHGVLQRGWNRRMVRVEDESLQILRVRFGKHFDAQSEHLERTTGQVFSLRWALITPLPLQLRWDSRLMEVRERTLRMAQQQTAFLVTTTPALIISKALTSFRTNGM